MSDALTVAASSKKVRGYVKAALRAKSTKERLDKLTPRYVRAKRLCDEAQADVLKRRASLSGGQMAAAERLLASPAIETLVTPCKPVSA